MPVCKETNKRKGNDVNKSVQAKTSKRGKIVKKTIEDVKRLCKLFRKLELEERGKMSYKVTIIVRFCLGKINV